MTKHAHKLAVCIAAVVAPGLFTWPSLAADPPNVIKEGMKAYHKAPRGVDPVCKKASDGTATPEELKKLVECYGLLAKAKPPRGDEASWKDKTGKLLAAAQSLQKGEPGAVAKYKEAVNCKACHSVHKPE